MADVSNPKPSAAKAAKARAGKVPPFLAAAADSDAGAPFATPPLEATAPAAAFVPTTPVPFVAEAAIAPVSPPVAAPAAAPIKEVPMTDTIDYTANKTQDTVNTAANTMHDTASSMGHRATEMFGDMNARAKDAMAKGTKAIEEFVEFSKGNMEAVAASGRVVAKGAEEIAKYSAEYGRATIEKANATAKQFASVKSPTEFFQLQGEVAKATLDALVAEGSKFTENYLKLLGEVAQPISSRVAVAADKVKSSTNA